MTKMVAEQTVAKSLHAAFVLDQHRRTHEITVPKWEKPLIDILGDPGG